MAHFYPQNQRNSQHLKYSNLEEKNKLLGQIKTSQMQLIQKHPMNFLCINILMIEHILLCVVMTRK